MRSYRSELFQKLSTDLNVDFIFTGCTTPHNNVCKEVHLELSKCKNLRYTLLPQYNWVPFNGFNLKLYKIPFNYSTIIFSGTLSAPFLILSLLFRFFGMKILVFDELHKWPKKYNKLSFFVFILLKITNAKILCASSYTSEMYLNKFKISDKNLFITGNPGGDISPQLQYKSLLTFPKKNKNIELLYLGRVIPYKCLHIIIKSIIYLPNNYILNIYGDGEIEYINFCKKIIIDNNLDQRVFFNKSVLHSDVAHIFKQSDLFIHIPFIDHNIKADSQSESWGYVINEAISLNINIISSVLCPAAVEANKLNLPIVLLHDKDELKLANLILTTDFKKYNYNNKGIFLSPLTFMKELQHALYY
jgi:glycosyltransferase involved in cell wall biosynthesis